MNLEKHELKGPGYQRYTNIVGHGNYVRELEEDVDIATREEDDDFVFARDLSMEDYESRENNAGVSRILFLL